MSNNGPNKNPQDLPVKEKENATPAVGKNVAARLAAIQERNQRIEDEIKGKRRVQAWHTNTQGDEGFAITKEEREQQEQLYKNFQLLKQLENEKPDLDMPGVKFVDPEAEQRLENDLALAQQLLDDEELAEKLTAETAQVITPALNRAIKVSIDELLNRAEAEGWDNDELDAMLMSIRT